MPDVSLPSLRMASDYGCVPSCDLCLELPVALRAKTILKVLVDHFLDRSSVLRGTFDMKGKSYEVYWELRSTGQP